MDHSSMLYLTQQEHQCNDSMKDDPYESFYNEFASVGLEDTKEEYNYQENQGEEIFLDKLCVFCFKPEGEVDECRVEFADHALREVYQMYEDKQGFDGTPPPYIFVYPCTSEQVAHPAHVACLVGRMWIGLLSKTKQPVSRFRDHPEDDALWQVQGGLRAGDMNITREGHWADDEQFRAKFHEFTSPKSVCCPVPQCFLYQQSELCWICNEEFSQRTHPRFLVLLCRICMTRAHRRCVQEFIHWNACDTCGASLQPFHCIQDNNTPPKNELEYLCLEGFTPPQNNNIDVEEVD
jgi:hypothetical protein